jgi:hypothetical protein
LFKKEVSIPPFSFGDNGIFFGCNFLPKCKFYFWAVTFTKIFFCMNGEESEGFELGLPNLKGLFL